MIYGKIRIYMNIEIFFRGIKIGLVSQMKMQMATMST